MTATRHTLESLKHDVARRRKMEDDRTKVRIWSGEYGLWWKADRQGYTDSPERAGVYPFADAWHASGHCGLEKRIAFDVVLTFDNAWRPISEAPKDGTPFWMLVGDDAIRVLWHKEFGEFVSSWRRMTMALGYTINGKHHEDHSPVIHRGLWWMPMPEMPE